MSSGGGRVLTITGLGDDVHSARTRAYDAVRDLASRLPSPERFSFRTDIAKVD